LHDAVQLHRAARKEPALSSSCRQFLIPAVDVLAKISEPPFPFRRAHGLRAHFDYVLYAFSRRLTAREFAVSQHQTDTIRLFLETNQVGRFACCVVVEHHIETTLNEILRGPPLDRVPAYLSIPPERLDR